MAKTNAKGLKKAETESIEVRYDLHELPTAQHKAGLAGLLLEIDSLAERRAAGQLPEETQVPDILERWTTAAVVRLTRCSAQDLFDDVYAAEVVKVDTKKRPFEMVLPSGPFLRRYTDDGKEVWHKLWQDMIWQIQRGKPTTRTPYNNRSRDEPSGEGEEVWKHLVADERARGAGGGRRMVELAGALMVGVQAVNAELVRFEDRADHSLLLHFWPLTARVFVPEAIDAEGSRVQRGFALAIPDVSDLTAFCRAYRQFLGELSPRRRGYRPADSVISLPAQASLEFMRHFAELASRHAIDEGPARFIAGVEYFQMVPAGRNVKMMAHGRIPPDDRLLTTYAGIRQSCRNSLFLSCALQAALRDEPWFAEFSGPMAERDWPFFVQSTQERRRTPPAMIGFAWDADRQFRTMRGRYRQMKEAEMPDETLSPEAVDALIYDLVRLYVRERACARAGVKPDDAGWWTKTAEERRDVCSKLFLELRSRNDDDFVRHFTATLGSVPQWLGEPEFLAVAAALMRPYTEETGSNRPRTRDDVKTLTLLALSAHSRSRKPRDADESLAQDAEPEETA